MAFLESYRQQVALLIRVLPLVAEENVFALKGGTAINLFVRDMPRLSVDIDLTYLPVQDRPKSLAAIDGALKRIADRIRRRLPGATINTSQPKGERVITKLIVRQDEVQIKIEVTPVLRGCVYDAVTMEVAPSVQDEFGFAEIQVVSLADLYAGKIIAALDRQTPRDLFDIRDLLANEGISEQLRIAFLIYLISHDRPIAELLAPTRKALEQEYERGFVGMPREAVTLDELREAREAIIAQIVGDMPESHRRFLAGFKRGEPEWSIVGISGQDLPAVRWKQQNLDKLSVEKRAALVTALENVLFPKN
jgi:predicted nucleotidyltransferase component of viral defense system